MMSGSTTLSPSEIIQLYEVEMMQIQTMIMMDSNYYEIHNHRNPFAAEDDTPNGAYEIILIQGPTEWFVDYDFK